jgi:biotin transport system permease protein
MAGLIKAPHHVAFGYRSGKTALHRMPAGLKLLCVMALSTASFTSVPGLAAAILLILAASLAARIPPWELLRGSKMLAILSLCVIIIKTFEQGGVEPDLRGITTPEIIILGFYIPDMYMSFVSRSGFFEGLLNALRIFVPFAAAALLFAVTTMRELRLSLASVEIKLKRLLFARHGMKEGAFFSLSVSLMLGFIPHFFDLWETTNLACDARSCKRGLLRLFLLVPLVTELMMEAAATTALALEARGFGSEQKISN